MNNPLVLVGGGHAHLEVLRRLIDRPLTGRRVILISPDRYQYYSGMFAAYVEGLEPPEAIRVDLPELCLRAGCEWIEAKVTQLQPTAHIIHTSTGQSIRYDCLSFNIGSITNQANVPGVEQFAELIKPNFQLPNVVESLEQSGHVVIAGGGASGVELSAAIAALRRRRGWSNPKVTLVHRGPLLADYPRRVGNIAAKILMGKGVALIGGDAVTAVQKDAITLNSGRQMGYERLLWLTGPAAPSLFRQSGLPVDDNGYLSINDALQSEREPMIFGAGDCVSMSSSPWIHKAGVYAVRQADILSDNLLRFLRGQSLRQYKPQKHYLAILSTGDREALLLYRGVAIHAGWCWRLKRWIDNRFIRKYQVKHNLQHKKGEDDDVSIT